MRANRLILKTKIFSSDNISTPFFITPLRHAMLIATVGLTASPSWAAISTDTVDNGEPVTHVILPEIVVTASRTPTPKTNVVAQTLVIDDETLQGYAGQSVLDVLKQQAGFNFYESGGQGSTSNFWLRGMSGKQVLVLIDGIRYSSMSTGTSALNLLPASQIDRIEVLYGSSGSSIYGSEAMGGVIQLFTKGQKAPYNNAIVSVGAGSQGSSMANVAGQYVDKNNTLSLSVGHNQTKGINATIQTANPYSNYNPDKDGYKNDNVSLVAKHRFNSTTDIGMSGLFAKSDTDYDSGAFKDAHQKQQNGAASVFANYQKDKLTSKLRYGESIDKSIAYDTYTPTGGEFKTRQQQVTWQADYRLPVGHVIGGAEWLKQSVDSSVYSTKERDITSGFIGYQASQPNYDFQTHVRTDHNSQYGEKTTYDIGTAYHILPSTRMGIAYATGFRVPTLNDLYNTAYGSNNPNLKPETNKNQELFIENQKKLAGFTQKTRLTYYHNNVTDLIGYNTNYQTVNIDKARITGESLTSDWQKDHLLFGFNYEHQEALNKTPNYQDKILTYHPKDQGLIYIGYRTSQFDIRAEAQHIGQRFTDAKNTDKLDSYTLINLAGNYYISPKLKMNVRLNNLLDKKYQTIKDYNSLGINSFVTLNYQWF